MWGGRGEKWGRESERERSLTAGRSLLTSTPVGATLKTWLHHQGEQPWASQVTLHLGTLVPPSAHWVQPHFPPHRATGVINGFIYLTVMLTYNDY